MHNPESVLENETHNVLWELVIQTDHLISGKRSDLEIVNNKIENLPNSGLCRSGRPPSNIERKRKRDIST